MIGANLKSLVPSHNQACLAILLVLQKSDITSTPLFPLPRVAIELEEFGTHLKGLFFRLLIGCGVNFLGEVYYGLEFRVGFVLLDFVIL